MALGTLWANKLRSFLTVLGVVIGITSIVGMTAIMRGFSDSITEMFNQLGPDTIIVQRSGRDGGTDIDRKEMNRRPNLTIDDVKALATEATTLRAVDLWLFNSDRLFYEKARTGQTQVRGTTEKFPDVNGLKMATGRYFTDNEVAHRRQVVVLGQTPYKAFFENVDPIGKVDQNRQFALHGGRGCGGAAEHRGAGHEPGLAGADPVHHVREALPRGRQPRALRLVGADLRVAQAGRQPQRRDRGDRDDPADPARPEGGPAERLRRLDAGHDHAVGRAGHAGPLPRPGGHLVGGAAGRRDRGDGDHDDLGHRADARDRRPQGARREAAGDPQPVPRGGARADVGWRAAGRPGRELHRAARPVADAAPGLDAVVVVRDRLRVLRRGRPLLRPDARGQGLATRPDRSPPLRVIG